MSVFKLLIAIAINIRQYRLKKTTDSSTVVFDYIKRHLPNDLQKIVGNKQRYIEE